MKTIFRKGIYNILKVFYDNGNSKVHLRELARRTDLNENSITRFLNELVKEGVLSSEKKDSVRKFWISSKFFSFVFSIFDYEKFSLLPFNKRKAILDYLDSLKVNPFCLILFGSHSKGNAKKESDLDLLEINNFSQNVKEISESIESERGVRIQVIRLNLEDFNKSLLDEDKVVLSAINTGFPIFGKDFFYREVKK